MKTMKPDIKAINNDIDSLPEGVSWESIIVSLEKKKNQQSLKKLRPSTLKYILEENNRPKVIQALLNALKKADPNNATVEYAEKLANGIQTFGQIVLKQKSK